LQAYEGDSKIALMFRWRSRERDGGIDNSPSSDDTGLVRLPHTKTF
jgi:hypothetical protein